MTVSMTPDQKMTRSTEPKGAGQKRAIVHLGLNKTGSTAIQEWLRVNADALAEQGFYYDAFEDSMGGQWPQASLIAAAALRSDDANLLADFRAAHGIISPEDHAAHSHRMETMFAASLAQAEDKTVILSSETLGVWATMKGLVGPVCDFLRRYFDEFTLVTYVREQADWLASAYTQAVKMGRFHDINTFAAERGVNDYDQFARSWSQEAAPEGTLTLRLYERESLIRRDVVEDFAATCGIDTRGLQKLAPQNEAISAREVRVLEILMRLEKRFGRLPLAPRAKHRSIARRFKGRRTYALSQGMAHHIRALNADSNERVRQRYFPDRPVLFANLEPHVAHSASIKISEPHENTGT